MTATKQLTHEETSRTIKAGGINIHYNEMGSGDPVIFLHGHAPQQLANVADWVVGKPSALLGLILIGLVVRWLLHRLIDRVVLKAEHGVLPNRVSRAISGGRVGAALNLREDPTYTRRVQRAATMGSLLKSIVTGVVMVVIALMFIAELGYDIAPLIASAGIIGVAIGFGSQALVKDFLSGIFMIFEDQYGVGDVVDLGEAIGTVEAVGLRVTRLRDVNGTVWYVRNGEIIRVGNQSQNWARTVLDVPVGYSEDLTRVKNVLQEVADAMWEDEDFRGQIIEKPEVWGLESVSDDAMVIRVCTQLAQQHPTGNLPGGAEVTLGRLGMSDAALRSAIADSGADGRPRITDGPLVALGQRSHGVPPGRLPGQRARSGHPARRPAAARWPPVPRPRARGCRCRCRSTTGRR